MATAGGPSLAALVLLWCALLHTTGAVRESALGHSLGVFPDADVPEEAGDSVSLDPDDPADEAEVNYLANEAEDLLSKAAERRMLLAIEVVLRLQRQWRRRRRPRRSCRGSGVIGAIGDGTTKALLAWQGAKVSAPPHRVGTTLDAILSRNLTLQRGDEDDLLLA